MECAKQYMQGTQIQVLCSSKNEFERIWGRSIFESDAQMLKVKTWEVQKIIY